MKESVRTEHNTHGIDFLTVCDCIFSAEQLFQDIRNIRAPAAYSKGKLCGQLKLCVPDAERRPGRQFEAATVTLANVYCGMKSLPGQLE